MARNRLELNLNSPHLVDTAANTANVSSRIARFQPGPGVAFELGHPKAESRQRLAPGQFYPVLKLYDGNGDELPGNSVITLAIRSKNSRQKTEVGTITYSTFRDLSTAEQRNQDYRGSVMQQLRGVVGIAREGYLEVWLESSVVVDLDQAATSLELPVAELVGTQ